MFFQKFGDKKIIFKRVALQKSVRQVGHLGRGQGGEPLTRPACPPDNPPTPAHLQHQQQQQQQQQQHQEETQQHRRPHGQSATDGQHQSDSEIVRHC